MLATTLLLSCSVLPTCLAPTARSTQLGATYREHFDDGVTALRAGEHTRAAERFQSAGRLAPEAPVWRAYRRRALELAGSDDADAGASAVLAKAQDRVRWDPVEVAVPGNALVQLSATGERLMYGHEEAALIEASSGRLIARLRSRIDPAANGEQQAGRCTWSFDVRGLVIVGEGGSGGNGLGLDLRDASTGRPIELEGAATFNPTPGTRYEWFPRGEVPPERRFQETVDLVSSEGRLRCERVPRADGGPGFGERPKYAVLNSSASLAMMRDQTVPTHLWVVDRLDERIVLERSPAGSWSWFAPDGLSLYTHSVDVLEKVALPSGEELWEVALPPSTDWSAQVAFTFLGDELVEVAPTGVVSAFAEATGARRELQRLVPAPIGPIDGAKFARGGSLLIVLDRETTNCYAMETGQRVWAKGGPRWFSDPNISTVDKAEQRCVIGRPAVVALETGTSLGSEEVGVVPIRSLTLVEGAEAAIVALPSGELRRVDLVDGGTTARALMTGGGWPHFPRSMANGQLWTTGKDRSVVLRDPETLAARRGARPGEGAHFDAYSEDGEYAVAVSREPARTRLVGLTEALDGEVLCEVEEFWSVAAFSPSGDTLALAGEGRLQVRDGRTGALRLERELLGGVRLSAAAFHRESQLIVGMSAELGEPYGGWVVDTIAGDLIAKLSVNDVFGGGTIMHIHSNPAAGVVILTASECGTVTAFDDVQWTQKWNHDTTGGNWGTLIVRHAAGSKLACISGMGPTKSRVFDVATGVRVKSQEAQGLMDLALTSSGRFLVGLEDDRLTVKDGESFATLYQREEATDGNAWITHDGTRQLAPGGTATPVDSIHLIRDGWSAPIHSFDAWLHDPLELVKGSLWSLPELPVIHAAEEVLGAGGVRRLAITGRSAAPLLGAVFEDAAGEETFVPLVGEERALELVEPVLLDAPPSEWASVRVVATSGVLSRPIPRR